MTATPWTETTMIERMANYRQRIESAHDEVLCSGAPDAIRCATIRLTGQAVQSLDYIGDVEEMSELRDIVMLLRNRVLMSAED